MDARVDYPRNRARMQVATIRQRVRLVFFMLMLGYLGLASRLAYLQIGRHDYYAAQARRIRLHTFTVPAQRGAINDRYGQPLAINIEVGDIIADPTEIPSPD